MRPTSCGPGPCLFGFALLLSACSELSPSDGVAPPILRGELAVHHVDYADHGETHHYLEVPGEATRRLVFDGGGDPGIDGGSLVELWGRFEGEVFHVSRFAVARPPEGAAEAQARALLAAPAPPARVAFVLVDTGGGVNTTKEEATKKMFGTQPGDWSVRQFFQEASFGKQDLVGEVFGPFKHARGGCDTGGVASALRPMITGSFDTYHWYFGSQQCGWLGSASGGSPARIGRDLWLNASLHCRVTAHEPGHSFGLAHASSLRCGSVPLADTPMGNCTASEYGDNTDNMGDGCWHYSGYAKAYLGWLDPCNGARVKRSATFTLVPLDRHCSGVQALQIPMPRSRTFSGMLTHYYLELRTPVGFDARSFIGRGGIVMGPTVMVKVVGDYQVGATRFGRKTFVLDMKPGTTGIDGMVAGDSYTDPAGGVKFTVESVGLEKASVKVELAAGSGEVDATCLDNSPLDLAAPTSCEAAGSMPPPPMPTPDGGAGGRGGAGGGGAGGAGGRGEDAGGARQDGGVPDARAGTDAAGPGGGGGATGTGGSGGAPGGAAGSPGGATGGASGAAGGTPPPSGGTAGTGPGPKLSGGCSCHLGAARTAAPSGASASGLALVLAVGWGLHRRRRRR
jgi:hypothetical protein